MSSVEYIIGTGGGPLGNVESGVVASLTTLAVSAVTGGLGCLAIATLIGLLCPAFARYGSERPTSIGRRTSYCVTQPGEADGAKGKP